MRAVKIRRARDVDGNRVKGLKPNDVFYLLPSVQRERLIAAYNRGKRYVKITGTLFPTEQVVSVASFTASDER